MRPRLLMASLAAMLLTAPMAFVDTATIAIAQDATVPPEVAAYLNDQRAPSDLPTDELVQRVRAGGSLLQDPNVPKDLRRQIGQFRKLAADELRARKAAAAPVAEAPPPAAAPAAEAAPPEAAPAPRAAPAAVPDEALAFLADNRAARDLSQEELVDRLKLSKRLLGFDGIPGKMRREIANRRRDAASEFQARKQAAAPTPPKTEPAPAKPPAAPAASAAVPDEARAFLADNRAARDLSREELVDRLKLSKRLLGLDGIPGKMRREIANRRRDAAIEFQSRKQAAAPSPPKIEPAPATPPDAPAATAPPKATNSAEAEAVLADQTPVGNLSDPDLRAKLLQARDLARSKAVQGTQRKLMIAKFRELRSESLRRKAGGTVKPTAPPVANTPPDPAKAPLDTATGAPDAEAKAQAFLAASVKPEDMKDADLAARLRNMRSLLQENKLSKATKLAIRQRLLSDREVFRARVAKRRLEREQKVANGTGNTTNNTTTNNTTTNNTTTNNSTVINNITNVQQVKVVLHDRRPADRLADAELRRRIQLYRDANDRRLDGWDDPDFEDDDRVYWRDQVVRDRIALRNRLIAARERRASTLRVGVSDGNFSFDLDLDFAERPSRPPPPPYIFVAEADDEEIETQLIAPPVRKPARRYTVKEIEEEPEIRASMPAIEIDTIKFGFGEANVREEEVESLDHIAEVIEKIIAKSPGEVFLIEGHTDAVGSDAANLELSRKRAVAVIDSLTTYYVIPAKNLKPVGYGERQLKIPTAEAEQENRRVSIRRVTPLVGALDE